MIRYFFWELKTDQAFTHEYCDAIIQRIFRFKAILGFFLGFEGSFRMGFFVPINDRIMIQRIQTIFLLDVIIVFVLLMFLPVYQVTLATTAGTMVSGYLLFIPLLLIPMAIISLLALVTIFSYKNRPRQIKMCRIGLILSLLISVNAMIFPQFFVHGVNREYLQVASGAYLFPLNIVFFALAAFFIKKDENLVKAADRLR